MRSKSFLFQSMLYQCYIINVYFVGFKVFFCDWQICGQFINIYKVFIWSFRLDYCIIQGQTCLSAIQVFEIFVDIRLWGTQKILFTERSPKDPLKWSMWRWREESEFGGGGGGMNYTIWGIGKTGRLFNSRDWVIDSKQIKREREERKSPPVI